MSKACVQHKVDWIDCDKKGHEAGCFFAVCRKCDYEAYDCEDEGSGLEARGTILVEMGRKTGTMMFTYREQDSATEQWAFSWGLGDTHVEVLRWHEGEELDTASSVDSIEVPDTGDNPSGEIIGAIVWMARNWIEENAEEATNA